MAEAHGKPIKIGGFNTPVFEGVFDCRYKRFFADVRLPYGKQTAHCPNTGSMKGLLHPGCKALVTLSPNPNRKLPYTLEGLKIGRTWVCVNTHRANTLARALLERSLLSDFSSYTDVRPEAPFTPRTRFDFYLSHASQKKGCFVEIKTVTLSEQKGKALFPDAITERGQKHLRELAKALRQGYTAGMVFLCMRSDCTEFSPAVHIDPVYARELRKAAELGVRVSCYRIRMGSGGFYFYPEKIPIVL